jgi:hypothetical protein
LHGERGADGAPGGGPVPPPLCDGSPAPIGLETTVSASVSRPEAALGPISAGEVHTGAGLAPRASASCCAGSAAAAYPEAAASLGGAAVGTRLAVALVADTRVTAVEGANDALVVAATGAELAG